MAKGQAGKRARSAKGSAAAKGAVTTREEGHGEDRGPMGWFVPQMEAAYSSLRPLEAFREHDSLRFAHFFADVEAAPAPRVAMDFWTQRLSEFARRKADARARAGSAPGAPAIGGVNNWYPIGPSVVARGQASGRPAISGRVSGIAVDSTGTRVYVATANGGVFRSDDTGRTWRSLMDGFDVDPTSFASTSLCMGAIATDPTFPDRIYAGTGEGDTNGLFASRLVNALPAYRGIGPIRSDDGGSTWVVETTDVAATSLAGAAFYALAVDGGNREHVVGATTAGLYERTVSGGTASWVRRRTGIHCSVIATRSGGATTFFAAAWGDRVYSSPDGATWTALGTGFPAGVSRIALAAQPDNPNVLYALCANAAKSLLGLYRLDGAAGAWKAVSGVPAALLGGSQGDYDLCIAVDPHDVNRIYVGGDRLLDAGEWSAAIYRCAVAVSGAAYTATPTYLGAHVHSDVHVLAHSPGASNRLWTGCDGGIFLNQDPTGAGLFESRNTGLPSLCTNFIGQSATEPAVLFVGLQDNGTARYVGEECWRHVQGGDGGHCIVSWNDPSRVLVYANGAFYRATDGGQDYSSWSRQYFGWVVMSQPMVGTPPNPAAPAEADIVAVGVGQTIRFSTDFGATFPTQVSLPAGSGLACALLFASATRLWVGTVSGRVFRVDQSSVDGTWSTARVDNAAAGALGVTGMLSDIAVDWSDAGLGSIFVSLGGSGDYRHVWHYDGSRWTARSGPVSNVGSLLDVEHNAIVVDPDHPANVYVGADVGVWQSTDGGRTWTPMSNGLPDAPVFDLQIHRGARLLRASTHGRGLFEYKLDAPAQADVELYVRDTALDTGRGESTDGHNDPTAWPTSQVWHFLSPNIKVDVPTPAGYQTPTNAIDFFEFNEVIVDGSQHVATIGGTQTVHNRVYVEVHNRGAIAAPSVQVMAVVSNASAGLGQLPAGYTNAVRAGTSLGGSGWTTLGAVTLTDLRAGYPQVAAFDLPSTVLPPPASLPGQSHFCLLAFVHSAQDPFASTERNVDLLTVQDRKVAQRNLHIVQFVGTPPAPGTGPGTWVQLRLDATGFGARAFELVVDGRAFPGHLGLVMPKSLRAPGWNAKLHAPGLESLPARSAAAAWSKQHLASLERLSWEGKYPAQQVAEMRSFLEEVKAEPLIRAQKPGSIARVSNLALTSRSAVALRIDPPEGAKAGSRWSFTVVLRDPESGRVVGGSTYVVVVLPAPKRPPPARAAR
jgi:hypothetical protein